MCEGGRVEWGSHTTGGSGPHSWLAGATSSNTPGTSKVVLWPVCCTGGTRTCCASQQQSYLKGGREGGCCPPTCVAVALNV